MCGLCGAVGVVEPRRAVAAMLPRLSHRGPDHQGVWCAGEAGLGHARLSIIDLSPAGRQPMANEDSSLWLAANGEIYNHAELRAGLLARGHTFRSASDSEVILHLYEEEGDAAFARLDGMFAVALWDVARRRLVLARDPLGIKPLYFHHDGPALLFASEIKALLAVPEVPAAIDPVGLTQYLTHANTFGARTLHAGIAMVRPGELVVWQDGRIDGRRYRRLAAAPGADHGVALAAARYRSAVGEAVSRHLVSDVEVAAYLSSGIDSSTVATLAAGQVANLRTFTGSFGAGGWYDETGGAAAVAAAAGTRHTVVEIGSDDLARHMDDLVHALDEPRLGMGAFSQYMVAREAARSVRVILTGHGGDEAFAGYPVFKFARLRDSLQRHSPDAFRLLAGLRASELPHLAYFALLGLRGNAAPPLPVLFGGGLRARVLAPEVGRRLAGIDPTAELAAEVGPVASHGEAVLLTYLRAYLPGLFVVEDKISMAHGLEARTPLCDLRLMEWALTLPDSVKLAGGVLKAVPKAAMRPDLPASLFRQPKRGFPTPLRHWLRGPLAGWARERLCAPDSVLRGLFDPGYLAGIVDAYGRSPYRHIRALDELPTHRLWALLSLESWLRNSRDRLGRPLSL